MEEIFFKSAVLLPTCPIIHSFHFPSDNVCELNEMGKYVELITRISGIRKNFVGIKKQPYYSSSGKLTKLEYKAAMKSNGMWSIQEIRQDVESHTNQNAHGVRVLQKT